MASPAAKMKAQLPPAGAIAQLVGDALREDIGDGDLTAALIDSAARASARLICREDAVLCGAAWFEQAFRQLDVQVAIDWYHHDGDRIAADDAVCAISGNARAMVGAERTAINLLQTLSATATATRRYVDAVRGTGARILDTRKTIPGLRLAQKYAVAVGGGCNHRFGLHDQILIKENHIAAGSISNAIARARASAPSDSIVLTVEVESLRQLRDALDAGAKRILLDNFDLRRMRAAVALARGRAELEASGNISLRRVRRIAETGVDCISVGALTKHLRAIDFSLRFR